MRRRWAIVVVTIGLAIGPGVAQAALTRADIARARLAPSIGAQLPIDVDLQDAKGATRNLGALLGGKPALVSFVDYTCKTLCGVTVDGIAVALRGVSLHEGPDYRVLVIGFNPADGPTQATAFRDARLGGTTFAHNSYFLSGAPAAIHRLEKAVGLTVVFDPQRGQYAHPAGFLLVTPQARVARVMNPLALTPFDLRLALVQTAQSQLATISDRVALLCYGFDAATGIYTLAIWRILSGCCLFTVLLMGTAFVMLIRRERQAPTHWE